MSFGGSVAAMITSLKNNARAKRLGYFDRDNKPIVKSNELDKLFEKKATPEQLEEIRLKMKTENRENKIKNLKIILLTLFLLIAIYLISQKIIFP